MKISQKQLREILISKALKVVSQEEAEYFADECIEIHLRKIPRNNPIKWTVTDLVASVKNKDIPISVENDLWASLKIDFKGHGPLVYSRMIHDLVEERSSKFGVCMISLVNGKGIYTLQHWVQWLAKKGIVSIISANGGPEWVIPHNGTKGVFWTNPLAFGIPNIQGEQCVDMATSEAPYFEIMWAHARWEDMREWIAVDSNGNPTSKTASALDFSTSELDPVSNLVPMGGWYKGYNIVYLLELMTSGLIGSPSAPEMSSDFIAEEHGAILIAMNPKALWTTDSLQNSIDSINSRLKDQTPKKGTNIEIPWMRSNKTLERNKDIDIEIDGQLLETLKTL